MKRITLFVIILFVAVSLWSDFGNFPENPATIGGRTYGDIVLPGFSMDGGIRNSLFEFSTVEMFEKGHVLTESEKEILTSGDLSFNGYGRFNMIQFGHKNWEFSLNSHMKGNIGSLNQDYLKLIFYGNSEDSYSEDAMGNTLVYQFMKGKLNWAYPKGLNLTFIPIFEFANKNSSEFIYYIEDGLNYIREMNLYLGANLNFYNANGYGEVLESKQEFITSPDSLYYSINANAVYTDQDEISSDLVMGIGLGMKLQLPKGWIHFGMDDLGAKLEYSNLMQKRYTRVFTDYLDLLDDDHEAIEEEDDQEEMPYDGSREVKLNPTVVFGVEHELGYGFSGMIKYLSCDYMLDGFFMGVDYRGLNWMPLNLTYGAGDISTYRLGIGFDTKVFEMNMGFIGYEGIFNASKGYGGDFGIRFKF